MYKNKIKNVKLSIFDRHLFFPQQQNNMTDYGAFQRATIVRRATMGLIICDMAASPMLLIKPMESHSFQVKEDFKSRDREMIV
jgi:hypothetical protein